MHKAMSGMFALGDRWNSSDQETCFIVYFFVQICVPLTRLENCTNEQKQRTSNSNDQHQLNVIVESLH